MMVRPDKQRKRRRNILSKEKRKFGPLTSRIRDNRKVEGGELAEADSDNVYEVLGCCFFCLHIDVWRNFYAHSGAVRS